ncbi:NADH-quinone oxidoreductase subunit NuoH [Limnoglobus roseus]|uniref:NADH-quinone oxidoreductase subunit H n=1 Tax=Limnoglobus roseus TaxID=2598579 RepID=A0A5C1AE89_9BACT|nr:NADH-quinone oxidoreductase subunit NuoH [Limnoglobus roseus]QEL17030.1 NADH-quinone oxidoreductase subunit NuoH [Limnoglobus roseus]
MVESLAEYVPQSLAMILAALAAAGLVFGFIGTSTFLFIWAERKISGRIQDRLGPTRVGKFGLLQSLADGIKLVTKEDFVPTGADRLLFRIAPYVAFCASFAGFIALPFAEGVVAQPLNVGAFFLLAVLSSEVFGVLLAGYSSANKWSLFGGVREAAQVVSYEVPRSLCVLVPICIAGTLNLNTIARQQEGWFWNWYVFHDPFTFLAFVIFFIVATASCKRAPFDLAEAESELVAGFLTEYSGMRWSYFFLAEYASMFAVSGLASLLFLGGWHTGLLPFEPAERFGPLFGNLVDVGVFITKGSLLVLVMMWMRWSLPRLRIDQVMLTCLKYFLPISCGLLIGVCVWQLYMPKVLAEGVRVVLAVGFVVAAIVVVLSAARLKPSPQLSGAFTKP